MQQPLVTVCIPAYNCGAFVADTLACLINQTYQNIQIVVVNDGSTDDTWKIINTSTDARIQIIDTKNSGAARARNTAYRHAKGAFIVFLDADDYLHNTFIAEQVKAAHQHPNAIIMADWVRFYDNAPALRNPNGSIQAVTFRDWIITYWYNCNPMTNPGRALIPRRAIEEAGLWNEELSLNDDLEYFTRVFLKASNIILNPNALLYYRSGVQGLSGVKSAAAYQSLYSSIELSVTPVLAAYPDDALVLQSCANMWQSFIYELYPNYPELTGKAQQRITELTPPNFPFPTGGLSTSLVRLFGWKFTKRLKSLTR